MQRFVFANAVVVALFIVDRTLKRWFNQNPSEIIGSDFFYNQLQFRFAKNFGVAFGINLGQTITSMVVVGAILLVMWMLVSEYRQRHTLTVWGLTFILIGAISNLFDRLLFGYVVDYIDVPWFTVFNIADVMITGGVLLLISSIFLKKS